MLKATIKILFFAAVAAASLVAGGSLSVYAQGASAPTIAAVSARVVPASIARGQFGKLIISVRIAPDYHIQSAKPGDPSLIATVFKPKSVSGVRFGHAVYPKSTMITTAGQARPGPAYIGSVKILVPFTVSRSAKAGREPIGGILTYQACNQNSCYPPKDDEVNAQVVIK